MTPVQFQDFSHRVWRFLFRAGVSLNVGEIAAGVGAHPTRVVKAVETLLLHKLVGVNLEQGVARFTPQPFRAGDREALRLRLINRQGGK